MEKNNRKEIVDELKKYIPWSKDSEYVSITEWTNGEGWDIDINGKVISLHYDELDMINYLTKVLEYEKF